MRADGQARLSCVGEDDPFAGLSIAKRYSRLDSDVCDAKTDDVRSLLEVVFRHSPDVGAQWSQSTTIGNAVPGTATTVTLPLKPGLYLAKAFDSSGIQSLAAATVEASQATALTYANVTSLIEHPTFPGAKAGCLVDSGVLKLTGSGQFDGISDFDAVPDLDAAAAALKAKGVEFTLEPKQARPGLRIAFVRGPQGISIELLQRGGG